MSSVAFSRDGKMLASGSKDATIKLWDVTTGKEQATLKGHMDWVTSVAFSPNSKTLASGSRDRTIKLWNVATGKEQASLKGHTNVVFSVAFSPDGKTLASASWDKTVKLWDVATAKERATLKGHTRLVYSVAFSPDGKTLASGSLRQDDQAVGRGDRARSGPRSRDTRKRCVPWPSVPTAKRWPLEAMTTRSSYGTWLPPRSRPT